MDFADEFSNRLSLKASYCLKTESEVDAWEVSAHNMNTLRSGRGMLSLVYNVPHQEELYYIVGDRKYKSVNDGIIVCYVPFSLAKELYLALCTEQDIIGLLVSHIEIGSDIYDLGAISSDMTDELKLASSDLNRFTYEMLSMYLSRIQLE